MEVSKTQKNESLDYQEHQTSPEQFQSSRQEQFVIEQNTCCLCGQALRFKHETDFVRQEVKEEAFCQSCQIRIKSVVATLH